MTMPPLYYFVVDAFTDRPFAGNPAAVVPLPGWRDEGWLQSVAMEMNLSETAFLVKQDDGYRLRSFFHDKPATKLSSPNHATFACRVPSCTETGGTRGGGRNSLIACLIPN